MKIYKKFEPEHHIIFNGNKKDLMNRLVSNLKLVDTKHYKAYTYTNENGETVVIVFNLIKHNRKVKHGRCGIPNRIEPLCWEGWIYHIPTSFLEYMNIRIEQGDRNFRIINL